MQKEEFTKLLHSMADAWTRRAHSEVLRAFSDDVRYGDPLRYSFKNKTELSDFFGPDGSGKPQKCMMHLVIFDEEQQVGVAEYTYEGEHQYHGAVIIRVRDGLITHWREYQHIDQRNYDEFVSGIAF